MHIQVKNAHIITVKEAEDIYIIMQQILKREHKIDRTKEHFWTISLNIAQKILAVELVSMGSSKATVVEPTEVFSLPLQKKAFGIILIHNHPAGSLAPSEADKDITDRLIQVGRIMNTPVLDHVIITEHSYYSFKSSGLLAALENSNKYVLPYELERQYHEEMQVEIKRIKKENAKRVKESLKKGLKDGEEIGLRKTAISMLQEGLEPKLISKITGMSLQQIEQIKTTETL
jgi:DNA repair protein RadC